MCLFDIPDSCDIINLYFMKGRISVGKKNVVFAYITAILMIAMQTVDVFYIHSTGTLMATNIVSRFAGIAVIIIFSLILKSNIRKLCFKRYNMIFEMINGFFLAAIPVAFVFGAEYMVLRFVKGYENLRINIDFPNVNDGMSMKGMLFALGVFALTVFLQSLFKELVFRGFLISQMFDRYGLSKSNLIQSVFYTLLLVPNIVQMYMTGRFDGFGWEMTAFIIVSNLFVDFLSGYKWGLCYRVTGSVWLSTVDHFTNNMLLTCLYITYGTMPMKWYVLQAVAVQLISFAIFVPVYFRRDRANEEIAAEVAVQRELAGMTVDNYSPSPVRHFIENRHRDRQEEIAKKKNMPVPADTRIRFPSDFEEPVSLSEIRPVTEDTLIETVKNDGAELTPEPSDDVVSINASPSEMSKEYFNDIVEQSSKTDVDITADMDAGKANEADDVSESASNISKLVQGYFQDNFEKYTYQKKEKK